MLATLQRNTISSKCLQNPEKTALLTTKISLVSILKKTKKYTKSEIKMKQPPSTFATCHLRQVLGISSASWQTASENLNGCSAF
ncbi:hypothetical protein [Pseudomonas fragi]|uniref:hypothetical protein n=1 Tax=Pseudomonas fragi TaxID=296 RepID=UPI0029553E54|nr:hypothetical protein [Pseudomonas fragi]WOL30199.1 hypothetical protein Q1A94_11680 [Pseudomonas fragi]